MKMKKTYIALLVCVVISFAGRAQQDPMFTQYMFNTLSINPAYAGIADALSVTAIHRSQWVGFDGAPVTQTISLHTPLRKESISVGGSVVNDQHGPVKQTGIYADASYRIFFDNSRLAFGLKAGLNLFSANLLDLNPTTEGDQAFAANISGKALPNFGFGMMWYNKKTYVGISTPKLLENELLDGSLPTFDYNAERRHFFVIAGTVFPISNYVQFKPSTLIKVVNGAPPGVDVTANFLFYDKFWAGAMYRWQDALGVLLQYELNNKFRIGYAFDYTLSNLSKYSNGSHEIMLGIDIGRKWAGDVSPRFFSTRYF
jgi:type IX secretion system PorP/SprF family membrane protein